MYKKVELPEGYVGMEKDVSNLWKEKNIVKKNNISFDDTAQAGEIDYSKVSVGTMLTKNEKNYYVLIYDSADNNAGLYSLLKADYSAKEDALSIYFCDLSNSLNSKYKSDNTNPKATKIEELALGDITLIKVSNAKISKYVEGFDNIKKELNI